MPKGKKTEKTQPIAGTNAKPETPECFMCDRKATGVPCETCGRYFCSQHGRRLCLECLYRRQVFRRTTSGCAITAATIVLILTLIGAYFAPNLWGDPDKWTPVGILLIGVLSALAGLIGYLAARTGLGKGPESR